MARTTISLPDDLVERIRVLKDRINVSELCRTALTHRVELYEKALAAGDETRRLSIIARLREERRPSIERSREWGHRAGLAWSEHASYKAIKDYGALDPYQRWSNNPPLPEDPPGAPGYINEAWQDAQQQAQAQGLTLDAYHWNLGFLEAATDFWNEIKAAVELEA